MANYQLTPEEAQRIESHGQSINELQDAINRFQKAGFDASALQRNLNAVKALRAGALKHLAPSVPKGQP